MPAIDGTNYSRPEPTSHFLPRLGITWLARLTCGLLAGALLMAAPMHAAQIGSCQPAPGTSGRAIGYGYIATPLNQGQTGVRGPLALRLSVQITRNGAANANGTIRIPDDPEPAALEAYTPMLVIDKGVVVATCADLDGDGRRDLAWLEADALVVATGEQIHFDLTPVEHDIDSHGVYAVALQIGDTTVTGDTHFTIVADRPSHKRRYSR